jgi:hypothetical protein
MGEILTKIKEENKNTAQYYKDNTMFFYEKYKTSTKEVLSLPTGKLQIGAFYFFHYLDDSNWMKFAPVFTADFKKFKNQIIIIGVNFNFIPMEIRAGIFDKFISSEDIKNNKLLTVDYKGVYNELIRVGYEYSLVEFNLSQLKMAHKIDLSLIHKFLYSGHPINLYDPKNLYKIWLKKLETREQRHQEMMKIVISEFYDLEKNINNEYDALKKHIERTQNSFKKYG